MTNIASLIVVTAILGQLTPRMEALMHAVRPLLPYPAAAADGEVPADNSSNSKWFVVWPTKGDDSRIVIKANPLNPDVQKASEEAMQEINAAVAAAERRAQAAYDKAVEQLRRSGKGGELESVTLDDEGIAGERIDAEQEVTIALARAESFEIASGEAPTVAAGAAGAMWTVTIPANVYRSPAGVSGREHFRAAEVRLYFGISSRPVVSRKANAPVFEVSVSPAAEAFAVVMRGNEGLVRQIATEANWSVLGSR